SSLKQTTLSHEASKLLLEGLRLGNSRLAAAASEITFLEHKGDEVIHEIFTRLNQTFITPIDPEDIHNISTTLDNVLDGIEDTSHRMVAYHVNPMPPSMVQLSDSVAACGQALKYAFEALETCGSAMQHCINI